MTREEAISVLAESKRQNEVMRDNPSTFWASHQMADGVKNAERRIAALDIALSALRPVSREQVEKAWRGCKYCDEEWGTCNPITNRFTMPSRGGIRFCPVCGRPLTDEAVQMVMERLEAMKNANDVCELTYRRPPEGAENA